MKRMNILLAPIAVVALLGLAACGGGGGSSPTVQLTPKEKCEAGGGTYADGKCTSAADRQAAQRLAISNAIDQANTAVAGLTDDASDAAIGAAENAVAAAKTAVSDAADLPDTEKAAFNTAITAVEGQLATKKTSIMAKRDADADAMKTANAKTGKAMHAALGPPAADNSTVLDNIGTQSLTTAGLVIDAVAGAGALPNATDPASVTLKAGDSAGSLGDWAGIDYALTTGTGASKLTNEARVYTNKSAAKSMSFTEKYGDANAYTASTRTFDVGISEDSKIKSSSFPTAGTKTFTGVQNLSGTYDGASGKYKCSSDCTATFGTAGITLSANWTFVHDSGAQVSTPDAHYLYFGWWVSKDKDGGPTAASAFAGMVGDVDGGDAGPQTASGGSLTGSATYAGNAAGKFAMSNPLDGTGNGGHFTADAMLSAKFGSATDAGMTGTIDNFRLNDGSDDPGWSVKLARGGWGSAGAITAPGSNPTVWSINGNAAPASGTWSGQMFDEMPGNAPSGDGSDVPTTVTGTFYSEFSTIGRMVGAFGATKQ